MPRCAACGSVSKWVRFPSLIDYLFLVFFTYPRWVLLPGQSDVFPGCGKGALHTSQFVFLHFCVQVPLYRWVRGGRMCFPSRDCVHLLVLLVQGLHHPQVFGVGSRPVFMMCLKGGSIWYAIQHLTVVRMFWGLPCMFEHEHDLCSRLGQNARDLRKPRTSTISTSQVTFACVALFSIVLGRAMCSALRLGSENSPPVGRLAPVGAQREAALRPPGWESTRRQRLIRQEARAWSDKPQQSRSEECERGRTNSPGLCTNAQEVGPSGWCGDCGGPLPRVGRLLTFRVRPSAAPQPQNKRNRTREEALDHTHCATQHTCTLSTSATARCDSFPSFLLSFFPSVSHLTRSAAQCEMCDTRVHMHRAATVLKHVWLSVRLVRKTLSPSSCGLPGRTPTAICRPQVWRRTPRSSQRRWAWLGDVRMVRVRTLSPLSFSPSFPLPTAPFCLSRVCSMVWSLTPWRVFIGRRMVQLSRL